MEASNKMGNYMLFDGQITRTLGVWCYSAVKGSINNHSQSVLQNKCFSFVSSSYIYQPCHSWADAFYGLLKLGPFFMGQTYHHQAQKIVKLALCHGCAASVADFDEYHLDDIFPGMASEEYVFSFDISDDGRADAFAVHSRCLNASTKVAVAQVYAHPGRRLGEAVSTALLFFFDRVEKVTLLAIPQLLNENTLLSPGTE
jgi:hypothetical protein